MEEQQQNLKNIFDGINTVDDIVRVINDKYNGISALLTNFEYDIFMMTFSRVKEQDKKTVFTTRFNKQSIIKELQNRIKFDTDRLRTFIQVSNIICSLSQEIRTLIFTEYFDNTGNLLFYQFTDNILVHLFNSKYIDKVQNIILLTYSYLPAINEAFDKIASIPYGRQYSGINYKYDGNLLQRLSHITHLKQSDVDQKKINEIWDDIRAYCRTIYNIMDFIYHLNINYTRLIREKKLKFYDIFIYGDLNLLKLNLVTDYQSVNISNIAIQETLATLANNLLLLYDIIPIYSRQDSTQCTTVNTALSDLQKKSEEKFQEASRKLEECKSGLAVLERTKTEFDQLSASYQKLLDEKQHIENDKNVLKQDNDNKELTIVDNKKKIAALESQLEANLQRFNQQFKEITEKNNNDFKLLNEEIKNLKQRVIDCDTNTLAWRQSHAELVDQVDKLLQDKQYIADVLAGLANKIAEKDIGEGKEYLIDIESSAKMRQLYKQYSLELKESQWKTQKDIEKLGKFIRELNRLNVAKYNQQSISSIMYDEEGDEEEGLGFLNELNELNKLGATQKPKYRRQSQQEQSLHRQSQQRQQLDISAEQSQQKQQLNEQPLQRQPLNEQSLQNIKESDMKQQQTPTMRQEPKQMKSNLFDANDVNFGFLNESAAQQPSYMDVNREQKPPMQSNYNNTKNQFDVKDVNLEFFNKQPSDQTIAQTNIKKSPEQKNPFASLISAEDKQTPKQTDTKESVGNKRKSTNDKQQSEVINASFGNFSNLFHEIKEENKSTITPQPVVDKSTITPQPVANKPNDTADEPILRTNLKTAAISRLTNFNRNKTQQPPIVDKTTNISAADEKKPTEKADEKEPTEDADKKGQTGEADKNQAGGTVSIVECNMIFKNIVMFNYYFFNYMISKGIDVSKKYGFDMQSKLKAALQLLKMAKADAALANLTKHHIANCIKICRYIFDDKYVANATEAFKKLKIAIIDAYNLSKMADIKDSIQGASKMISIFYSFDNIDSLDYFIPTSIIERFADGIKMASQIQYKPEAHEADKWYEYFFARPDDTDVIQDVFKNTAHNFTQLFAQINDNAGEMIRDIDYPIFAGNDVTSIANNRQNYYRNNHDLENTGKKFWDYMDIIITLLNDLITKSSNFDSNYEKNIRYINEISQILILCQSEIITTQIQHLFCKFTWHIYQRKNGKSFESKLTEAANLLYDLTDTTEDHSANIYIARAKIISQQTKYIADIVHQNIFSSIFRSFNSTIYINTSTFNKLLMNSLGTNHDAVGLFAFNNFGASVDDVLQYIICMVLRFENEAVYVLNYLFNKFLDIPIGFTSHFVTVLTQYCENFHCAKLNNVKNWTDGKIIYCADGSNYNITNGDIYAPDGMNNESTKAFICGEIYGLIKHVNKSVKLDKYKISMPKSDLFEQEIQNGLKPSTDKELKTLISHYVPIINEFNRLNIRDITDFKPKLDLIKVETKKAKSTIPNASMAFAANLKDKLNKKGGGNSCISHDMELPSNECSIMCDLFVDKAKSIGISLENDRKITDLREVIKKMKEYERFMANNLHGATYFTLDQVVSGKLNQDELGQKLQAYNQSQIQPLAVNMSLKQIIELLQLYGKEFSQAKDIMVVISDKYFKDYRLV